MFFRNTELGDVTKSKLESGNMKVSNPTRHPLLISILVKIRYVHHINYSVYLIRRVPEWHCIVGRGITGQSLLDCSRMTLDGAATAGYMINKSVTDWSKLNYLLRDDQMDFSTMWNLVLPDWQLLTVHWLSLGGTT